MIKPTVGRVVYYKPRPQFDDEMVRVGEQPLRADVLAVNSDTSVNLNIIDAAGNHFAILDVFLVHDTTTVTDEDSGYAYWMPYQLGQAAKTEAAEAALLKPKGEGKAFPIDFNDQRIEGMVRDLGLNAPRLTPEYIDSVIDSVTYTQLPSGRTMICELTLANGFTIRGESTVVSIENFNLAVGQDVAFNDARNKVWQLEAYLMKQRMALDEFDTLTRQPEFVARVAHEVNRAYCQALGDNSQPAWRDAPQWQKESAMLGAQLHTDNPDADPAASHESWMAQKVADGWKYGPNKDPANKKHPCIVPFYQLPIEQQAKDYIFRGVVHALVHDKL